MREFDVVIIGAGSAGYVSAIKAAQLQKKVAIIERDQVGGTCLNRGCIPTKTLLHTAEIFYQQKDFSLFGIESGHITINPKAMNQRKEEVIHKLRQGIEQLLASNQVTLIQGNASIQQETIVKVNDELIHANNIVIATGSSIASVPIQGIEHAYTSDDILEFSDKLFDDVIIIGGGVIGVEFAMLYNLLRSNVTIIESQDRLLSTFDKEISQNLAMILKRRGATSICSASVSSIVKHEDKYQVTYIAKGIEQVLETNAVIVAVGRKANGIESNIKFELESSRFKVNTCFQTNYPNIYAVGDASSTIQLAHIASQQGIEAIVHMFGTINKKEKSVPMCVYTNPEIACVGITEAEAKEAGMTYLVGKYMTLGNGKTIIENQDRGFVKVIVDADSNYIIGAQLMCDRASDMISIFTQAIDLKLRVDEMQQVIYPHPSFSEAIHEALCDVSKQAIHIIPNIKK